MGCDQVSGDDKMFTLHIFPHKDDDEEVEYGRLLTVEFHAEDSKVQAEWVKELFARLKLRPRRHAADHAPSKTLSMAWLAIFAYLVEACEGIHNDFGISNSILGF